MAISKKTFSNDFFDSVELEAPATSFMSEKSIDNAEGEKELEQTAEEKTAKNKVQKYSKTGKEKRTARVIISLKPSFYEQVKERADKDHRSISNLMCSLLEEYIANENAMDKIKENKKRILNEAEIESVQNLEEKIKNSELED